MAGFTLVELLTTLTILMITLAIALPAFAGLIGRQQLILERERFGAALNNARIIAISSNRRVTLCPSLDGQNCRSEPFWEQGWLQFEDRNANREHDPKERIMRHEPGGDSPVTIRSSVSRRRITYQSTGLALGSNVTISFCHPDSPASGKALIVANSGRVRRSDERPGGEPLTCP
jgi:type IV fimbrial biogenesis protein FimT